MEIAPGLERKRRTAMADSAEDDRSGRYPDLRLRKRSLAHAADHTASKDRQWQSYAVGRGELVGVRKDLYPWQRNLAAGTAGRAQQHTGQSRNILPLPAIAAAPMAKTKNCEGRLDPNELGFASQSNKRHSEQVFLS